MVMSADSTIGGLVAEQPGRTRVFERLGLDYCCAGKRKLGEACAARGLDVAFVLRELEAEDAGPPTGEPDWTRRSASELADHIEATHHAYLRGALPRIEALTAKVVRAHGARHPELTTLQQVFAAFRADLADHMEKEERVLFPWVRRLEAGKPGAGFPPWSVSRPVSCMEHEHEEAGRALARMNELTGGYRPPEGACSTYRAMLHALAELETDTHRHVHKENSILFPRAIELEKAAPRANAGMPGSSVPTPDR